MMSDGTYSFDNGAPAAKRLDLFASVFEPTMAKVSRLRIRYHPPLMASDGSAATTATNTTAARLVRAARAKRGMSQRDLARAAGVPQSTVATVESGMRQPSVLMLERLLDAAGFLLEAKLVNNVRPSELLHKHHTEVAKVIARYPVARVWIFGSVARGDDGPGSDLDLLVDITPGAPFAEYVELEDDLAAVLGCPVDVVTTKELESNDLLRHRVRRHLRPLEIAA